MTGEVTQADVTDADREAVTRFHAIQIKRIMAGDSTLGDNRDVIEQAFARHRLAATRTTAGVGREEAIAAIVSVKQAWSDESITSKLDRREIDGLADAILALQPIDREAVEAEAYERAAKVCDDARPSNDPSDWTKFARDRNAIVTRLAAAIRNLGAR